MAGETTLTVIGNLTADPELRFTPSGAAVANFTVASTPRAFRDGKWEDGEALFLRCNVWRQAAENTAESLRRGDRVIVYGRLKQRSFETKEGEKRTVVELDVEELAASVKFATVSVRKATRNQDDRQRDEYSRGERRPSSPPPDDDPWGSRPPVGHNTPASNWADEPPF